MKTFYVISALLRDSSQLGNLQRHSTEKDAIEHAKSVIEKRRQSGSPEIDFYVLKVQLKVGPVKAPVKVERLK